MTSQPVFVVLNETGAALARKAAAAIGGAEVHGLTDRVTTADLSFQSTSGHLKSLFDDGRAIVAVASTGIVIRSLGEALSDKQTEPPVLSVSIDGKSVVPLLGGHHGANKLARELAKALDGQAAITTAGDSRFGLALDDPPRGWRCVDRALSKPVMAALLASEAVSLINETEDKVDISWLTESAAGFSDDADQTIRLTHSLPVDGSTELALCPAILTLGIGCERGVKTDDLAKFVRETLVREGIAKQAVACVATVDIKEDETAIREVANLGGIPLRLFTPERLEEETPRVTDPSDYVFETVGTHSVAEAAALAAAGPDAELIVAKRKGEGMTCAVARSPCIIDPDQVGRGTGRLVVVGIGPGTNDWRAPEATRLVAGVTDVVGYSLYMDILGPLMDGKVRHDYKLGEESDRVAEALDLAASGREVALVSSGDAGIYAMASLVFELIETGGNDGWQRLEVQVVPGISALQAAAARAGAPLGHDFCTVSLSDLLTPWEVIENRLKAAAAGDFVISLYNPVSMRRREQLVKARDIILGERGPETPVILARNLGREEEKIDVITLGELQPDIVDMLTLVMIGSTETRAFQRGDGSTTVYTPRGYSGKEK